MNRNSSPYASAGWLLNEHLQKRRGIKSIAFENSNNGNGKGKSKNAAPDKATYATVCKSMQHLSILNEVLNANDKKLRKAIGFDTVRNKGLLYVMLYELLFGKYKSIRGGGKLKRLIVKQEKALRSEAEECVAKHGGVVGGDANAVAFPRYIRVNTLRANVAEVVDRLKEDLSAKRMNEGDEASDALSAAIYADAHIPDLLVLPPTASSWLHHDYEPANTSKIVLQDKSSCFSALAMACGLGEDKLEAFDYIDACAAPGNKTSHLAALVCSSLDDDDDKTQPKKKKKGKKVAGNGQDKPKSTIFAFERNSARYEILSNRMEKIVAPPAENGNKVGVTPIHGDYLKADPSDPQFANVKAIMLDPSCSGSGIVNSPDRWMEESGDDGKQKKDMKRIQSLSNFQLVALKHSMSFPNVDRIVYSTCSVHEEENEAVVAKALSEVMNNSEEEEDGNEWQLMAPVCLEHWPRRGKEGGIGGLTKDQANCLIRANGLDGDETNGFFVSFFVRKRLADELKKRERKAIDIEGVPTYDGQFVGMCKKANSPANVETKDTSTEEPAKSKQQQQQGKQAKAKTDAATMTTAKAKNSAASSSTKAAEKSAKKREKKLAWKRKQALQKGIRMKKKEATSKSAQKE